MAPHIPEPECLRRRHLGYQLSVLVRRAAARDAGRPGRQQRGRERARCAALARRLDPY